MLTTTTNINKKSRKNVFTLLQSCEWQEFTAGKTLEYFSVFSTCVFVNQCYYFRFFVIFQTVALLSKFLKPTVCPQSKIHRNIILYCVSSYFAFVKISIDWVYNSVLIFKYLFVFFFCLLYLFNLLKLSQFHNLH